MINYIEILSNYYANKKWTAFDNCSYEEIKWLDSDSKPTEEELSNLNEDWELKSTKDSKILELESARKAFQYSNIIIQINGEDKEFIATLTAQTKLLNYLSTIDWTVTESIEWRLADGITFITMSEDEIDLLVRSIIAREMSAYQQESAFLSEIQDCLTADEVEDVKINFS
jgi:hypothetical protein